MKALEVRKLSFGEKHPLVAQTYDVMATLLVRYGLSNSYLSCIRGAAIARGMTSEEVEVVTASKMTKMLQVMRYFQISYNDSHIHDTIQLLPETCHIPEVHLHPLTKVEYSAFTCDVCGGGSFISSHMKHKSCWRYACRPCDFDAHIECCYPDIRELMDEAISKNNTHQLSMDEENSQFLSLLNSISG
jgi:predicted RNA-binding Zn-ribbon protein involved in translation (DUF1610 family)